MFRGIGRAWQLLEEHVAQRDESCGNESVDGDSGGGARAMPPAEAAALQHARRIGARYDLVLRVRPDLCFCGPLDLSEAVRRPGHFWLPWASTDAGLAFDQIGAGSAAMMSLYSSAYHATAVREVASRRELYPEAVMWRHLAVHGRAAAEGRVARLGGFRASLARHRADGAEKYDDPFGKLKLDLMHQTSLNRPSLAASLPDHACGKHHGQHLGGGGGGGGSWRRERYRTSYSKAGATAAAACAPHADDPATCKKARRAARKAARSGAGASSERAGGR